MKRDYAVEFVVDIAKGLHSLETIARLLEEHSEARSDAEPDVRGVEDGAELHPHRRLGTRIALFVREYKEEHNYTSPFVFLGEAEYVKHEGSKPLSFVWRLAHDIPPAMIQVANKVIV